MKTKKEIQNIIDKFDDKYKFKHIHFTDESKRNLARLALGLHDKVPKGFNMRYFLSYRDELKNDYGEPTRVVKYSPIEANKFIKNNCGTAACAGGWAAAWRIGTIKESDSWDEYIYREFLSLMTETSLEATYLQMDLFDFFFDGAHVNSPKAAANRIAFALETGLFPYDECYRQRVFDRYRADWDYIKKLTK